MKTENMRILGGRERAFARHSILAILLLCVLLIADRLRSQSSDPLQLEAQIPLANVQGRIDHFSVDVEGHRLFVAAVENHTLEVIGLKPEQRVHTIPDLAEPQGVYYDAETNRLFVACALDGVTKIFDGTSFQVLATVKFPDDADNIRYDARTKNVIVGYAGAKQLRKRDEGTGGLGFLDTNGKKIADVVIDAHPESFQLEKAGSRIFVNVPDKKEIEVVDAVRHSVAARWPVTSAGDNFPMALDESHHRLFVACRNPARLLVFDTEAGKAVASADLAGGSDDLFYDASRSRIYVLTNKGFLEAFQQEDADHYSRIGHYPIPPRSQTGLFVPAWGKLFVAVPGQDGHVAEVRVYRTH